MVLCFGAALKAQTYVGELDRRIEGLIPGCFTSNGHPYLLLFTWDEDENDILRVLESDFVTTVTDIDLESIEDHLVDVDYVDLDAMNGDLELVITQTLFNDDPNYEYIEREREYTVHTDTIWEYNYEEDLPYYVYTWYEFQTKAIRVKSTNGSTVWEYLPEENSDCSIETILKFDNKFYMILREENDRVRYQLYLIKQNQGVTKVETPSPLKVFPTLLHRDQQITVELGESNNASEITVVNSVGQVVKRISVEQGQRTVTIPARDLGRGLNVVNSRSSKGQGSCKIIVQ